MSALARDVHVLSERLSFRKRLLRAATAAFAGAAACAGFAQANPALLVDAETGAVLYQDEATQPWFPASVTKLMTVYVALDAVRNHRIGFDTPLAVSPRAVSMPPSKMGFRPGSLITLGNALKILMVKSANDTAVTVAEGVSGSVEAFAEEMNATAAALGMTQSHFVNPHGLPSSDHVSSARDLAILARALYAAFPDQADLFSIGALRLGGKFIANHNNLLGRYPGVDGMKTGFTCPAGFNVVASATIAGRRLIAVVLGSPSATHRMVKAAALFDRGFAGIDRPAVALAGLQPRNAPAPDLRPSVCHARGRAIVEANAEVEAIMAPLANANAQAFAAPDRTYFYNARALAGLSPMAGRIALTPPAPFDPVPVFVGAPADYAGPIAQARPPHSPIGTPGGPAIAYVSTEQQNLETAIAPLAPRHDALSLKRGRRHGATATARLKLPMPADTATKLIEGDDGPTPAKAAKTKAVRARGAEGKAEVKAQGLKIAAPKPVLKPAAHVADKSAKAAAPAGKSGSSDKSGSSGKTASAAKAMSAKPGKHGQQ